MGFLHLSDRGKQIFNECRAFLESSGIYKDIDAFMLEMYAFNVQTCEKLLQEINVEGEVIDYTNKGGFKNKIINPKLKIYQEVSNNARQTANLYGLTPAGRIKLKLDRQTKPKGKGFDLTAVKGGA